MNNIILILIYSVLKLFNNLKPHKIKKNKKIIKIHHYNIFNHQLFIQIKIIYLIILMQNLLFNSRYLTY